MRRNGPGPLTLIAAVAHSPTMHHPTIDLFEKTANLLDVQNSAKGLDDAIAQLAAWMDVSDLSEDDWVVLVEVGAILYREGLRRRLP